MAKFCSSTYSLRKNKAQMAKGPPRSHASPPKSRVVEKQLPGQAITQLPLHLGGNTWRVLECGGICMHVCHSGCMGASPPSLLSLAGCDAQGDLKSYQLKMAAPPSVRKPEWPCQMPSRASPPHASQRPKMSAFTNEVLEHCYILKVKINSTNKLSIHVQLKPFHVPLAWSQSGKYIV